MTKITKRMISIRQMQIIMDSVPYKGGDWDDQLVAEVDALPAKMDGITEKEMATIGEAYSCPRMVSDFLGEMFDEIDGLEAEIDLLIPEFLAKHREIKYLHARIKELQS